MMIINLCQSPEKQHFIIRCRKLCVAQSHSSHLSHLPTTSEGIKYCVGRLLLLLYGKGAEFSTQVSTSTQTVYCGRLASMALVLNETRPTFRPVSSRKIGSLTRVLPENPLQLDAIKFFHNNN